MNSRGRPLVVLAANTTSFTVCFAVWMMYGVLITFLVDQQLYAFTRSQMGWLIGVPVLTGSLFRLPAGMLADRFGGRPVFAIVMLLAAASAYLTSFADSFAGFLLGGLGFGVAGSSFAVGVAYTSIWFPPERQGTALGVFGAGNIGAALTPLLAPLLLLQLTDGGAALEHWRWLPRAYAVALVAVTVLFWLLTEPRRAEASARRSLGAQLRPLRSIRVWRFGLYYFLVFGGFVALSQWLIPYYVGVYGFDVGRAGLLAAVFALPASLIRALGGWLADRTGTRVVMYWVLGGAVVLTLLLAVPRMDVRLPGEAVLASRSGVVTEVTEEHVRLNGQHYELEPQVPGTPRRDGTLVFPTLTSWQEPVVQPGEQVTRRGLLARGVTHIYFQANVWIFSGLVLLLGLCFGVGMGAVYRDIPTYFPRDVGTVGGIVGVIGGLGGFVGPILFGYLLEWTGVWTTSWILLLALSLGCLLWLHSVVRRMMRARAPEIVRQIDEIGGVVPVALRVYCPVHAVEAQVRVFVGPDANTVRLGECSLGPGQGGRPPCEGRCLVEPAGDRGAPHADAV